MKKNTRLIQKIFGISYCIVLLYTYAVSNSHISGNLPGRYGYYGFIPLCFLGYFYIIFIEKYIVKSELFYMMIISSPFLIAIIYDLLNKYFNISQTLNAHSSSMIGYWILPIITAVPIIHLLKEKTIDYTYWAMCIYYFIVFLLYVKQNGLNGITHIMSVGFQYGSILEAPLISLSIGLVLLYYIENEPNENKGKILVSCLIILLTGKRIVYFAIISITLLKLFTKNVVKRGIIYNCVSIVSIASSYVYIFLIKNGILENLFSKYEINTMGRDSVYRFLSPDYEFSLSFMGQGLGFATNKMSFYKKELFGIGDVHSDILKLFIELGFWGFTLFFIYFIFINRIQLKRLFSAKMAEYYFLITTYTMILCFTDNILRYRDYLLFIFILPYCTYLSEINQKGNDYKSINRN